MLTFEKALGQDLNLGTGTATVSNPGGGVLSGHQISISTLGLDGAPTQAATATWNPPSIPSLQSVSTTVAVAGAAVGDFVLVTHDQLGSTDLQLTAHVQVAGTVRVVLANPTPAAIDVASGTLKVLVLRPR